MGCGSKLRRSQSELIYAVLDVLYKNQALKVTHIMYKVNINALILRNLLGILAQSGFVESSKAKPKSMRLTALGYISCNSMYRLTEKGVKFYLEVRSSTQAINRLIEASDKQRYASEAEKKKN